MTRDHCSICDALGRIAESTVGLEDGTLCLKHAREEGFALTQDERDQLMAAEWQRSQERAFAEHWGGSGVETDKQQMREAGR